MIHFIYNPNAGIQNQAQKKQWLASLDAIPNTVIWETTKPLEANEFAKKAIEQKATKIIAIGGDGTINEVASALTETTIPKFNIEIASKNASFQYPDLPKSVKNIVIDTHIINETGLMNDTYVNLDQLSFTIDQDVFNAKANVRNLTENPLVNAELKGTVNLANVTKAYPVQLDKPLTGILKADVTTKFDMKSVETSQYQNIQNSGTVSLTGFN